MVNELLERISLTQEIVGFRYLNLGGKVVYIIGFKNILKFSSGEISFKINNSTIIAVKGNNLYIKEMDSNSAMVCGEITSIEAV